MRHPQAATPLLAGNPSRCHPSSSRVSPARLHPLQKAITQEKRRENVRKSDIIIVRITIYRKLVTYKVGAQSATSKKRSWKQIIVEKRRAPHRMATWTIAPYYKTLVHILGSTFLMTKQVTNNNTILFFSAEYDYWGTGTSYVSLSKWRYGDERMRKTIIMACQRQV